MAEEENPIKTEQRPELTEKWPGYEFMAIVNSEEGTTRLAATTINVWGKPLFQWEDVDEEGEEFWAEVIVRKLVSRASEARMIRTGKGRVTGVAMAFKPSELPVDGANRAERRWQKRLENAETRKRLRHSSSYYGRKLQSKEDKKGNKE